MYMRRYRQMLLVLPAILARKEAWQMQEPAAKLVANSYCDPFLVTHIDNRV